MARYQAGRLSIIVIYADLLCGFGSLPRANAAAGREKSKISAAPLKQQMVKQQTAEEMKGLPLAFEPNRGQTDPQVRFLTRASGMTVLLTDHESMMVLSRRKNRPGAKDPHKAPENEQTIVRMKLAGAKAPRSFEGLEKLESISNYFIGNVPPNWVTNVANYRKVRASGVYKGVDLLYYGDGRKLEYDFVVQPGADPRQIRLAYSGVDSLSTDKEGNLVIATRLGSMIQHKPKVYQEIGGKRQEIEAEYSLRGGNVEFALANWDRKHDLVIDPVLEYSSYLGEAVVLTMDIILRLTRPMRRM